MANSGDGFTDNGVIKFSINFPPNEERKDTPLFTRTKKLLAKAVSNRCYICGRNAKESKAPLEAHHHPIMRAFMPIVDWVLFAKEAKEGIWGARIASFDWAKFDPLNPVTFVDDMRYNGMLLCVDHHRTQNQGIHNLPYPLFIAQKYAKEGYVFSGNEVIVRGHDAVAQQTLTDIGLSKI